MICSVSGVQNTEQPLAARAECDLAYRAMDASLAAILPPIARGKDKHLASVHQFSTFNCDRHLRSHTGLPLSRTKRLSEVDIL